MTNEMAKIVLTTTQSENNDKKKTPKRTPKRRQQVAGQGSKKSVRIAKTPGSEGKSRPKSGKRK